MTLTSLDILAILAIGFGGGLVLALVAAMVYALLAANRETRRQTASALATLTDWLQRSHHALEQQRLEVGAALARFDPERLQQASLAITRSAKSLAAQVGELEKVVFAKPATPALDFSADGMDEDLQPQREPWPPMDNPLERLTEQEKQARVNDYFQQRERERRQNWAAEQNPFSATLPPAQPVGPAPPFTGAYADLVASAATSHPPAATAPADFSGTEPEAGVELSEKGELE